MSSTTLKPGRGGSSGTYPGIPDGQVVVVYLGDAGITVAAKLRDGLQKHCVIIDGNSVEPSATELSSSAAVVLVLDRLALEASSCEAWVSVCGRMCGLRPEFRLFALFCELTVEEVCAAAESGTEAARELRETVHLAAHVRAPDLAQTIENVRTHLSEFDRLRERVFFNRLKRKARRAAAGLVIVLLIAASCGYIWFVYAEPRSPGSTPFVLLAASLGAFLYFTFLAMAVSTWQLSAFSVALCGMAATVFFQAMVPASTILAATPYIIAGLLIALCLDCFGRSEIGQLAQELITISSKHSDMRYTVGAMPSALALIARAPYLGRDANVFVSYSRLSDWGTSVANDLERECSRLGTNVFVDVHNIDLGTSWRHRLIQGINEATVFIALYDEITVSREWPKLELLAAARRQMACGLPLIILVRHPDLDVENAPEGTPLLLRELMLPRRAQDPKLVRHIEWNDATATSLARGLGDYTSFSLFGQYLSAIVYGIVAGPRVLLSTVGEIGQRLAIPVALVYLCLSRTPLSIRLSPSGQSAVWLGTIVAYCLGYGLRIALASRFERLDAGRVQFRMHAVAVATMIFVLWLVGLPSTPALLFAFAAALLGFLIGSDVIRTINGKADVGSLNRQR